jgi:ABC-type thiamine transport system substrate-binding protein
MMGEGSLGEVIQKTYSQLCLARSTSQEWCRIEIVPEEGASSLVASFIKNKNIDAVLGLDDWQMIEARKHRASQNPILFAKSPHALIVNLKVWPKEEPLPKSWKELLPHKNKIIIQDPRVSVVGLGWIKAIYVHKLLSLKEAQSLTQKSFPSWSLSYESFTKGAAPLIWSYQTSEAYHICNNDGAEQFKVLPLEEGYPQQEEWALLAETLSEKHSSLLKETLLSDAVQNQIAAKNYMLPAKESAQVPDCFLKVTPVKVLHDPSPETNQASSQAWRDSWSL